MLPHSYSETVAVVQVPASQQSACVTYCDLETNKRCKSGVTIKPVVCTTSFRDSVFIYLDSTRRRYVSSVDCVTCLRPTSFSDTSYVRPRAPVHSFATWIDHCADRNRKWYKSSVCLEPRVYSTTRQLDSVVGGSEHRKSEFAVQKSETTDRKSDASSSVSAMTDADASMESLDDLSDFCIGSSPEVSSPLRASIGSGSPMDNVPSPELTITTRSLRQTEVNGNAALFGCDMTSNHCGDITQHRSGPFIYNVPKRRAPPGGATGIPNDNEASYHVIDSGEQSRDGHVTSDEVTGVSCLHRRSLVEDLVDL